MTTPVAVASLGGDSMPAGPPPDPPKLRRRKQSWRSDSTERKLISARDMDRRSVRYGMRVFTVSLITSFLVIFAGPLVWLFKFAVSATEDIVQNPLGWWPSGMQWGNLVEAWDRVQIGRYMLNTFWVAGGTWLIALFIATTGGFALSILRPKYASIITAATLATLFIPGVVALVSLYLTILDLPFIHLNLINTYWAVWLPAASSAFNLLIVKRFFDNLPRELFDAATVDGAGPIRLFWSIVLPLSKPIIGVLSIFTFMNAWEAFLWPLLVLPDPSLQPLSVALARLESTTPISLMMAGMFISVIVPLIFFIIFQRQFLKGAGQLGMTKG